MKAYKTSGADDAVKTWVAGSALEGNKDALSQSNLLRQIQDYYGAYRSYTVVKSRKVGENVQTAFVVVSFDKGPLFGRFDLYHAAEGWILTSFTFNTKADVLFPSDL